MEDVYRNAFVTISAVSSSHCDGGLFEPNTCSLASHTPAAVEDTKGNVRGWVKLSVDRQLTFKDEPLNSRAWTFQEWILSPRLLIYTDIGAIWQCEKAFKPSKPQRSAIKLYHDLLRRTV